MSTRVFVRLYDGQSQYETDDEVLELPSPPLKWKDAINAMVAAVGKQDEYEDGVTMPKARLFLLPIEAAGIAAELNARSLRFGVRENDRFVICLRGEDYQQPSERQASAKAKGAATAVHGVLSTRPMTLFTLSSSSGMLELNIPPYAKNGPNVGETNNAAPAGTMGGPPRGGSKGGNLSGSLITSSKKGNKRYRSISGKMAAIKSLGDMGLISNDDRGHLKDLLLNSDSPQLQEALDKYNNTGDFQAVKNLLVKEIQNPPLKRNTTDWLSESFVNDIALNFNTTPPAAKAESIPAQKHNDAGWLNAAAPTIMTSPANTYRYQKTSHQSTPLSSTGYLQTSSMVTSQYSAFESLTTPTGGNLATSSGYTAGTLVSNNYQPTTVMRQLYHQPQASPTNMYSAPPQINLPLRDRATYMKRGLESSPVHNTNMMSITSSTGFPAMSAQMGMNGYVMQQGYVANQGIYPANIIYAGDHAQYSMSPYMAGTDGAYNQYQQQTQYAMNRYSSKQSDMGYNFYPAGFGFGKSQFRAGSGGKWTTAPPMPSYPPPCSKEEKKEKIAKWLKKRENRNWSNKPSYPVRHSIAKNRKRGEDGRFITKARLAEMAAREAAAAAALGNSNEPQKASLPSLTSEASISIVSQTGMPQATPVP